MREWRIAALRPAHNLVAHAKRHAPTADCASENKPWVQGVSAVFVPFENRRKAKGRWGKRWCRRVQYDVSVIGGKRESAKTRIQCGSRTFVEKLCGRAFPSNALASPSGLSDRHRKSRANAFGAGLAASAYRRTERSPRASIITTLILK